MVIFLQTLFCFLLVAVAVIVANAFRKEKLKLDKKYFERSAVLFVVAVAAVYLYDYMMGYL